MPSCILCSKVGAGPVAEQPLAALGKLKRCAWHPAHFCRLTDKPDDSMTISLLPFALDRDARHCENEHWAFQRWTGYLKLPMRFRLSWLPLSM